MSKKATHEKPETEKAESDPVTYNSDLREIQESLR